MPSLNPDWLWKVVYTNAHINTYNRTVGTASNTHLMISSGNQALLNQALYGSSSSATSARISPKTIRSLASNQYRTSRRVAAEIAYLAGESAGSIPCLYGTRLKLK